MTETVLFVGGSADGKRWVKDNTRDHIDIPVMEKCNAIWSTDGPERLSYTMERYCRVALTNGTTDFPVFLSITESPDNLIPLLIAGYGKKE